MIKYTQGMWKPFLFAWVHLFLITVSVTLSRIKWFLSLPKYWGQMDRAPSAGRPIGYAVFCWWPLRHRSTWNCVCPSHAASGQCWAGSKISPRELRRCFTVTLLVLYYFKMWILAATILSGFIYLFNSANYTVHLIFSLVFLVGSSGETFQFETIG